MQIVAADIGNSSIKYCSATIDDGWQNLTDPSACRTIAPGKIEMSLPFHEKAHWWVSSVNPQLLERMKQHANDEDLVDSWHTIQRTEIPLEIDLNQPEMVGIDRLLAGLAAHRLSDPHRDTIVVDCGTALTIDLVSADAVFRGGVIMAGPRTSLRALSGMTASLPDLSEEILSRPPSVLGRCTRQAMLSGTWFAGLGAIRLVVSELTKLTRGEPQVVGTGGGLGPWRDELPQDWKLVDDLVLEGIFHVAQLMGGGQER